MKTLTQIAFSGLLIVVSSSVLAQSSDPFYMSSAANMCFEQAERAASGTPAVELSTASCNIALDNRPLGPQQEVAMLHNRGVIQMAQGYNDAAVESFELAIEKSDRVGPPHVALAQLSLKRGNFRQALELYDAILESGESEALVRNNRESLEHNRTLAQTRLESWNLAHTTP